jgi:hypothetical protein
MLAPDPYYDNVLLLLPMFGTFADLSKHRHLWTANGAATITSGQSKYYGASGYFNKTTGCFLTGPKTFDLGSSDFCIEFWLRIPSYSGASDYHGIIAKRYEYTTRHGFTVLLDQLTGTPFFTWTVNGVTVKTAYAAGSPALNTWIHFAFVREGGQLRKYQDGVLKWTDTQIGSDVIYHDTTEVVSVGRYDNSTTTYSLLNGWLQDLRVTVGVPRYTSAFTPPRRLIETIAGGFMAVDANITLRNVSGAITDRFGQPCQRKVYAMSRPTDTTAPQILAHGLSDPSTGAYELIVPSEGDVTRVVVSEDNDPLLNDLVDRVIPA